MSDESDNNEFYDDKLRNKDEPRSIDELALKREEKNLIAKTTKALDDSLESIDNQTLARLKLMRQQAVVEAGNELALAPTSKANSPQWMPAAGIAAVLTVALLIQTQVINSPSPGVVSQDALAKNIVAHETIELSQSLISEQSQPWQLEEELLDDMDFYAWLALQEQVRNVNAG